MVTPKAWLCVCIKVLGPLCPWASNDGWVGSSTSYSHADYLKQGKQVMQFLPSTPHQDQNTFNFIFGKDVGKEILWEHISEKILWCRVLVFFKKKIIGKMGKTQDMPWSTTVLWVSKKPPHCPVASKPGQTSYSSMIFMIFLCFCRIATNPLARRCLIPYSVVYRQFPLF